MSNQRKSTVLLEHHLKQLKLPTILKEYQLLAKSCSRQKCDYPTYLLRLCEKELADRQKRAMDRRIQAAKFPMLKTIDSFDFASQKSVNEPLLRELLRCEFMDPHENVLLMGNSGTGKTHLAAAIANYWKEQFRRVIFVTVSDLLDYLRSTFSPDSKASLDKRFLVVRTVPLLVLDDLSLESATPWAREKLAQLLDHRYNARLPTVITTASDRFRQVNSLWYRSPPPWMPRSRPETEARRRALARRIHPAGSERVTR